MHVLRKIEGGPRGVTLIGPRAHGYELPVNDEHNFISRMLHKKQTK